MSARTITVVPYDPRWPALFAQERAVLAHALADVALDIFHIGSTAVPGLAAKPIIDILVAASSLAAVDDRQTELAALGYLAKGENGIAGRRYFQKGGAQRSHHLHVYQHGDPHLHRHLAFRDYLRAHPALASEYAALKQMLALSCNNDSRCYQNGKADFLQVHQARALAGYARAVPGAE